MTNEVWVRLTKDKDTMLVEWADSNGPYLPYAISYNVLLERGRITRAAMAELALWSVARETGCTECGVLLRRVAEQGRLLRAALFRKLSGDGDPAQAEELISGDCRITAMLPGGVQIPLGLAFEGELPPVGDDTAAAFDGFWYMRYSLVGRYRSGDKAPRLGKSNKVLLVPIMHKKVYDNALAHVPESQRAALGAVMACSHVPIFNKNDALPHLTVTSDGILYFYCHANSSALCIGDTTKETLAAWEIEEAASQKSTFARLLILNGCSTAIGDADSGFLKPSSLHGLCGFIGTETVVPDVFALRFGAAFLYGLLSTGRKVHELMRDLRGQHWPLSLAYGVYCHPNLSLAPMQNLPDPGSGEANFSIGTVGTRTLS